MDKKDMFQAFDKSVLKECKKKYVEEVRRKQGDKNLSLEIEGPLKRCMKEEFKMINAQMVKELREKTGAGMMDCKKALSEANGDMEKAVGIIRKKGLAVAVKKADRITAEGVVEIYISEDRKSAGIVEFNCETDFVAANKEFRFIAKQLAKQAAVICAANIEEFISEKYNADESTTIKEVVTTLIAKLGENMTIRRFAKFKAEETILQTYMHGNGRIGVIAEFSCSNSSPITAETAKDIAMQIAAQNPIYINKSSIDEKILANKRESYIVEAELEGKPEKVVEKIAEGKLQKYLKEVCLLDQAWVKNPDYTVAQYLKEKSKETEAPISVVRFVRFERGEGMEKKEDNFAEEVYKQIK